MSYSFNVKPIVNKANKSLVINPPKKNMPKELKQKLNFCPEKIKSIKFKLEGWEEW